MRLQDASIACTICAHDFFFFSNSIPASVRVRDSPNAPDVWLEPSVVWVCSLLLLYCCFTVALLLLYCETFRMLQMSGWNLSTT